MMLTRLTVRNFKRFDEVAIELGNPVIFIFYQRLGLPNLMRKTDYHVLAGFVPVEALDPEIGQVLDRIVETAQAARPAVA